jgi:uncharacterized membrane protein YeaQ/YmgE (transglycosylase-associated protein family)
LLNRRALASRLLLDRLGGAIMLFPIAGVILWAMLGGAIGWFAGKVTGTTNPNGVMANSGVGMLAAIVTGAVFSMASGGEPDSLRFGLAIVFAALSAIIAVSLYRLLVHDRASTMR